MRFAILPFIVFILFFFGAERPCAAEHPQVWSVKVDGLWGFIDRHGKLILEPRYQGSSGFSEGLAAVWENDQCGYIDITGKYIIAPQYVRGSFFSRGLAKVLKGKEAFLINRKGERLDLPLVRYAGNDDLKEGLRPFSKMGKYGFKNLNDEVVIKPQFSDAYMFSEGLASVEIGRKAGKPYQSGSRDILGNRRWITPIIPGKWGFIDARGKLVIPAQNEKVGRFDEGLASVKRNGKWGYISTEGKQVIPFIYDKVNGFSEGLVAVKKDGSVGFINQSGKVVIPHQYRSARRFNKGMASVQDAGTGKWGYINPKGKVLIDFKFDQAYEFHGELALVWMGEKMGYINRKGDYVWRPTK